MKGSATRRPEILVVGAGPTRLTAALELTRRGHAVRVIEKNLECSSFSKTLAITAATLKTLTLPAKLRRA
jgi:2-polyprenyl-6-methoxyphenol hydroxylase-like FAD-dependent oxidoreductase